MDIYVGNLSYKVGKKDLQKLFSQYGYVMNCKIIRDADTRKSKGFGFVEMYEEDAILAIEGLNGEELKGNKIKVKMSKRHSGNNGD